MENLQLKGTQEFMGINIPVIEGGFGNGKKVMLAKTISEIHKQPLKKINQLINDNLDEFEIGIDIIDLKSGYLKSTDFLNHIMNKQSIANSSYIYLLSEQGYMALTSLMKTEKAKEIRKKLRREYFAMREIINSDRQKKAELLLTIYDGGQNGVLAAKKLTEMEVKSATIPLLENISQKEVVIERQDRKLETQKPFVEFALNVQDSGELFTMEQAAKILSDNGVDIGRNTLMKELRQHKILMENNSPYEKYRKAGLFVCKLVKKENHYGTKIVPVTRVTGKGLIFLSKKLREWHGLEDLDIDLEEFDRQVKELQRKREEKELEKLLDVM